jgi:D-serine deaminase-like pyridoxal phosphate-dependent protein
MKSLHDLPTPALLIDLDRLESNLRWMADRTRDLGVSLRPHIKTHKCVEIAERQRALGATGITVSTLYEAQVFANHGFDDITWAFPLILSRIGEVIELAGRVRLSVVVDSQEAVDALNRANEPVQVILKVDCGYHRAGVDPQGDDALALAKAVADSPSLQFAGILSHSGHAYNVASVMVQFAERLRAEAIEVPTVSVGSTPAMRAVRDLQGVTEARPGNYALFDYKQVSLGSCTPSDCAVTVLSSVVSSQPGTEHCVVDAGALALSKDTGPGPPHHPTMGEVYRDYGSGDLDPDTRLVGMSQEHGRLNRRLPVGSQIRILPNHSCLTVAEFGECYAVRGAEVVDRWRIWSGRD